MNNSIIIISSLLVFSSSLAAYTPKLSFNSTVTQVTSADGALDPTDAVTPMTNSQLQIAIQDYIDDEEIYENELLVEIGVSDTDTANALSNLTTAQGTESSKQGVLTNAQTLQVSATLTRDTAQTTLADKSLFRRSKSSN